MVGEYGGKIGEKRAKLYSMS